MTQCKYILVFVVVLSTVFVNAQVNPQTLRQAADLQGKGVGMFIQPVYWNRETQYKAIMGTEYNRAITFHTMQQTAQGVFDFTVMDQEIAFAQAHNMKLFGAGLIYRNNASPAWLHFDQPNCGGWTQAQIDAIIKTQVQTIIQHGGSNYSTWEVVNEPLSPGGNGCWSTLMGGQDQMIAAATKYAAQVTTIPILINDAYGRDGIDTTMVDNMIALVKRVVALGGHVDALGTECHLRAQILRPTYVDELKYFLTQSANNNLQTQITEMDVYQGAPGDIALPYLKQKEIFQNVATQCSIDPNCTAYNMWGLTDKYTWLRDTLPQANPLPFDENYAKKPAYYGILTALTPSYTAYQTACTTGGKTPIDQPTWTDYSFTNACYTATTTTPSFTGQQDWTTTGATMATTAPRKVATVPKTAIIPKVKRPTKKGGPL